MIAFLSAVANAADLVTNPNSPSAWTFEAVQMPGGATMRPDSGALRIDITRQPAESWHVQLYQLGKTVRDGAVYAVRFTAKASTDRTITMNVQTDSDPWRPVIDIQPSANLTTQWKTYTLELRIGQTGGATVRLPQFLLGQTTGTIWIKDVSVNGVATGAVVGGGPATSGPGSSAPPPSAGGGLPTPVPADPVAGGGGNGLLGPLENWQVASYEGAQAAIQMLNGIAQATVATPGRDRWNVQMFQAPDGLSAGHPYILTIGIRSDAPRKVGFIAQHDQEPYEELLPVTDLNVGPEWKQYKLKFTLPRVYPGHTRLLLQIGDMAGKVELRKGILVEATGK